MPMANTKTQTLSLTRIFDAPVDLVWRCWTEKQHLDKAIRAFTETGKELGVLKK